jgi:hypothetical protein
LAGSRVAGHAHDLHHAVVHLRHFAPEQGGHIIAVRARNHHLRAAPFLAHLNNQSLHAVAALVVLARDLLLARENGFGAAQVDDPAALVPPLDDAGDDLAHAVFVFLVNNALLGVAHALNDDLLGRLRGNAAQILHPHAEAHLVVQLHGRVVGAGLGQLDLRVRISQVAVRHHDFELIDLNIAGLVVIAHLHVRIFAEAAQHRGAHGVFQRFDEHIAVQALVFADLINGLFEFKIHLCLRLPPRAA